MTDSTGSGSAAGRRPPQPRRVPTVRAAVHRTVPFDSWTPIVNAMVDLATSGGRQAVAAAQFLAAHCPAPDELDAEDEAGPRAVVTSGERVDEIVETLAARLRVDAAMLPGYIAAAFEAKRRIDEAGGAPSDNPV